MLNHQSTSHDIAKIIYEEIRRILATHNERPTSLADQDALHDDLGLTSFDTIQLFSFLTRRLHIDPFEHSVCITSIRTIGDLCRTYQTLLDGETSASVTRDTLLASQIRAQTRRASQTRRAGRKSKP